MNTFSDVDLLDTLKSFRFAGADSGLSNDERFARGVAQVVRTRLLSNTEEVGSHSVFLLQPIVPDHLSDKPSATFYALDDGETDVTSGVWFVGAPVIRGVRIEAPAQYDQLFPKIVAYGLGGVTAVTYRKTSAGPHLRYYPDGLAQAEHVVSMTLADDAIDIDRVLELVDIVHKSTLVTPSGHQGGAKLWKNRVKYYPVQHVEAEIQAYLRTGLSVGLPLCRVNPEQNLVHGRLDLEIEELDPGSQKIARHAVLELKVLRSFGSTGAATSTPQTERWVKEGVDQAYAYTQERNANAGALCCFDMRKNAGDDACLKKVESKAQSLNVTVRSWPLYPDAKRYRSVTANVALSAGSRPTPT